MHEFGRDRKFDNAKSFKDLVRIDGDFIPRVNILHVDRHFPGELAADLRNFVLQSRKRMIRLAGKRCVKLI